MKILSCIVVITLLTIFGCNSRTNIKSLQENPRNYVNKEVTVEGKVSQTFSLYFINYFELDDGTGKINVITKNPLPNENESISVKGTVQYYTLGTMRLLVIKENDND